MSYAPFFMSPIVSPSMINILKQAKSGLKVIMGIVGLSSSVSGSSRRAAQHRIMRGSACANSLFSSFNFSLFLGSNMQYRTSLMDSTCWLINDNGKLWWQRSHAPSCFASIVVQYNDAHIPTRPDMMIVKILTIARITDGTTGFLNLSVQQQKQQLHLHRLRIRIVCLGSIECTSLIGDDLISSHLHVIVMIGMHSSKKSSKCLSCSKSSGRLAVVMKSKSSG
jgi:hypothetical protein